VALVLSVGLLTQAKLESWLVTGGFVLFGSVLYLVSGRLGKKTG
jgi:hypothetical protein